METYFKKITGNVYCFLLWDESWQSYNNCYVLLEDNRVILIDSGKQEHFEYLEDSLDSIGIQKEDITEFVATHGHKDHIGGVQQLSQANKFIHEKDIEIVPGNLKQQFTNHLPNQGNVLTNLECIKLGHHTQGSVALYHHNSRTLFCGDYLCFFGDPLPEGQIIVEGDKVVGKVKEFISHLSYDNELRKKHNFDLFIDGLQRLSKFDAQYLCTGHGVVIKNSRTFLTEILQTIE